MRREKRVWIYAGLGVPEGAALVRSHSTLPRRADGRRVLLIGREEVRGLVPPMARLAGDSGASLRVDERVGMNVHDWSKGPWLQHHLLHFDPTVVFMVVSPHDELAAARIRRQVEATRTPLFWLAPPPLHMRPHPRVIPARSLTASGYAAWAGQAWRMVVR